MQGFKSFPERTKLNFDKGITIVVGPNGSGKSNISDAVKWVLGERSPKSVRGSKMEDVIFSGSEKRSPMGYAEVTITFDNSEEAGKVASLGDYDEIAVTRRYYRAGESEYFINKKKALAKDVTELFLNTGIGKNGYSIVGQGKIAEIISSKSEDKRKVFEEASGIAKYRYQKEESERKLESTVENLIRLEDIENELKSRIGPLERDSEKAKKYLEIFEQKKGIDVSLAVYDLDNAKGEKEKLEENIAGLQSELSVVDADLEDIDRKYDEVFNASQKNRIDIENVSRELSESIEKASKSVSSAEISKNDNIHLNEKLDEVKERLASETKTMEQESELAYEKGNLLASSEQKIATLKQECENLQKESDEYETELEKVQRALQESIEDSERIHSADVDEKIRLSAVETSKGVGAERLSVLKEDIEKYEAELAILEGRYDQGQKLLEQYQKQVDEIQSKFDGFENEKANLNEELTRLSNEKNEVYLQITQRKHRLQTFERMEELLEGYSHAVKTIMSDFKNGLMKKPDRSDPKIYGPVSKIIGVSEEYATSIEVALGPSLQNIIVEDEETAKYSIRYLKNKNAGRATFYPTTTMRGSPVDGKLLGIEKMQGYVAVANNLVTCDNKFRSIIDYLLGRTIISKTMDDANAIAKFLGFKYKVVTLDGQVINAGGSFTGGSSASDSGMLSRHSQTERLNEEIKSLEKKDSKLQSDIDEVNIKLSEANDSSSDYKTRLSIVTTMFNAEQIQNKEFETQISDIRKNLDQLREESTGIELNIRAGEDNEAEIAEKRRQYEESLKKIDLQVEQFNSKTKELEQKLEDSRDVLSEKSLALAVELKNAASLKEEFDRLTLSSKSHSDEVAALNDRKSEIIASIDENIRKMENASSVADELIKKRSELEERKAALSQQAEEYEGKSARIREKQKEYQNKHDLAFTALTKAQSAFEKVEEKTKKLIDFLFEEYDLTPSEAHNSSYPKITEKTRGESVSIQNKLKNEIKALGNVNVGAIEEYKEVKSRYDELSVQTQDLRTSKDELLKIIFGLEEQMRSDFTNTMNQININFDEVFKQLFGGGSAEVRLTDPVDVLNCGIEINVALPGKKITSMTLLSGGEQAFIAIALYFAIMKVNPSPFCILDEIEAALDEVNVDKFAEYVKNYTEKTQFVIITHRRGTMAAADTIYGVTMHEKGISDILSIDVSEIEERLGLGSGEIY